MNTIVDKLTASTAPWEIGAAIFSTNRGEYERRIAGQNDRPPLVMRSDPDEDMAQMASRLQSQFPSECRAIQCPTDCPIDIYGHFDHYDVYIQGSSYLHEVLSSIAFRNLARLHEIVEFVDSFKSSQVERFNDIHPDTQDLFTEEEKTTHSQEFLEDVLIRLKALKLAAGNMAKQEPFTLSEALVVNAPNSGTLKVNEAKRQSSAPDHALGSLINNSSTSSSLATMVKPRRFSSAPSPPRAPEILIETDVDAGVERATEAESQEKSTKLDPTAHPRRRSSVSAPFSPRYRPLPQRVASAQGVYSVDVQQKQRRREHYTDPEPQYANPTDQYLGGYQLLGPIVRLDSNEAGYPTVKAIPIQQIYADSTLPRIPQYGELAVVKNDSQQAYYNRIENVQVQGRAGNRQSDHRRFDSRRSRQLSYQGPPDNTPADLHFTTNQRHAVGYRSTITSPGMHPINAIVWGKPNDTNNFHHPGAYSPLPYYAPQPEVFHSRRTSQPNIPRRRQTLQNSQIFPSDNRRGPPGPGAHTFGQPGPPGPLYVTKTRPPMGVSNDARVIAQQEGQYRGRQLSDAMPYRTVSDSPRYNFSWLAESHQTHIHQIQDLRPLAIPLTSSVESRRCSDRFYQQPYTGLGMTNQTILNELASQPAATAMGLQSIGADSSLRQVSSGGWSMDTNPYARQEGNEAGTPSYMPVNANGFDRNSNVRSGLFAIDQVHSQARPSSGYQHSGVSDMLRNTSALRPDIGTVFVPNASTPFYQPSPSTIDDTQQEETKLWISGNKIDVHKETLLELFSQCGHVKDIVMLRNENNYPYAFILYEVAEHAARAIDRFDRSPIASLNGRSFKVRYAEKRNRRRLNRSSTDKGPSGYRLYQPTNRRANGSQGRNSGHSSMITMPHTGAHNQAENVPYHDFQGSWKNKMPPSSSQQSSPEKIVSNSVGGTEMQEHFDSTSTPQPQILGPHPQIPAQPTTRRNQKSPKEDQDRNLNEPPNKNEDRNYVHEKDMPTFQQENRKPMQATSTTHEDSETQSSSQIGDKPSKGDIPGNPDDLAQVQNRDVRKEAKTKRDTAIETSEKMASKIRRGQQSNHWSNSSSKPIALEDYMRPRSSQKRKKERQGLFISGSVSTSLDEDYAHSDQVVISAPHPELDDGTSLSLGKPNLHAEHEQADDPNLPPTQYVYEGITNTANVNVPVEKDNPVILPMEENSKPPPNDTSGRGLQNDTPPALQLEASLPLVAELEAGHRPLANNSMSSTGGCLHDAREDDLPPESSNRLSDLVEKPHNSGSSSKEENFVVQPSSQNPILPCEINLSDQVGECSILSSEDDIFAVSSHEAIIIQKGSDLAREPEEPSTGADMIDAVSKSPSAALIIPASGPAVAVVNTPEVVGSGRAVLGLVATPDRHKASKLPEISSLSSFGNGQALGISESDNIQDSSALPSPGPIEVMSTPIETRKKKQFGTKSKRFPVPKKSVAHISNIFDRSQIQDREGQGPDEGEEQDLWETIEPGVSGKGIGLGFEPTIHREDDLPTSNMSESNEEPIATKPDWIESEEVRNIVRSSCPSPEPLTIVAAQDLDGNDNFPGEDTLNSSEANFVNDSAATSPTAPKGKSKKKKSKKKKKAKNEEASTLDAVQSPAVDEDPPNKYMPEPEMPWVVDNPKSKEPKVRTYNHPLLRQLDIEESTSPSDLQSKRRRLRAVTDIDAEGQSLRAALVSQPHIVALLDDTQRERADKVKELASVFSGLRAAFAPRKPPNLTKDKIEGMVDSSLCAQSSSMLGFGEPSKEQPSSVSQVPLKPWKVAEDYYIEKARYSEMLYNVRQAPFTSWTDGGDSSSSPGTIMDDSFERFSPLHDNSSHFSTDPNTEHGPTATTTPAPNIVEDYMSNAKAKADQTNLLERLGKALGVSNIGDDTMDEVNRLLREVEDASEAEAATNVVDSATIGSVDDSGQSATDNTRRTSLAELGTNLTLDTKRQTSIMEISDDSSKSEPAVKTPSSSPGSATEDNTGMETSTPTPSRRTKQAAKQTEEATPINFDTEDMFSTHTLTKSKGNPFSDLQFTQRSEFEENILSTNIEKGGDPISTPLQHWNDDTISTSMAIPSAEGRNADYGVADEIEHVRHTTSIKISDNDARAPSTTEAACYIPSSPGACLFPDETTSLPTTDPPPKATDTVMGQDHGFVQISNPPSTPKKIFTRASPTKRSPQVKVATMDTAECFLNDSLPPLPPSPKDRSASNSPVPHSPKGKGRAISTDNDIDVNPPSPIPQPYTPTRKDFSTSANSAMETLNSSFTPSGVEDLSPSSSPPRSHFNTSNVITSQSGASEASEEERPFTEKGPIFEEFLGKLMNGGDPWSVPSGEKRWGSRRGKN